MRMNKRNSEFQKCNGIVNHELLNTDHHHSHKSSLLRTPSINMAEEAAPVVAEPYNHTYATYF